MTHHDLVEEFRRAYVAGQRPDAREYIDRVPEEDQEALGAAIRAVLAQEPPPPPAPETLAMVQAMLANEHPLMVLRQQKGLSRDAVVGRMTDDLGLPPADQPKVAGYYHELETGQLPLAGIRDRVFDALARALGVARTALVLEGPPRDAHGGPAMAFARTAEPGQSLDLHTFADMAAADVGSPDEVDDLFTGGPG